MLTLSPCARASHTQHFSTFAGLRRPCRDTALIIIMKAPLLPKNPKQLNASHLKVVAKCLCSVTSCFNQSMKCYCKAMPTCVSQRELKSVFPKANGRSKLLECLAILSEVSLLKRHPTPRNRTPLRSQMPASTQASCCWCKSAGSVPWCLRIRASQVSWKPALTSLGLITIL